MRRLLTLVFPISSLNLLVGSFLHLPLQNPCPSRLVIVGDLEDVGSVYIVVTAPAHDMVTFDIEFEDWDLEARSQSAWY